MGRLKVAAFSRERRATELSCDVGNGEAHRPDVSQLKLSYTTQAQLLVD